MKYLAILFAVIVAGCDAEAQKPASDFDPFKTDCARKNEQQSKIQNLIIQHRLGGDPDLLDDDRRVYNSRLKSTWWWYELNCKK
jgi:hypothetical protein